MERID
jgi:hypothetical protein